MVCKVLAAADFQHSSIGSFVKDALSIASLLKTFSFSHTRQQGNFVAHTLATRARLSFPLLVWMEHIPPDNYFFGIF